MNEVSQDHVAAQPAVAKGVKRSLVGRVTSNKVLIERREKHPLYGKYLVQSKKIHAHTEEQIAEGDLVEVQECRPISRTKTWSVVRVIERAA